MGTITQFFGVGGSGKSNICLQFSRQCIQEGKRVIFVDTEGVSSQRMMQVFGRDRNSIDRNMLVFKPFTIDQQVDVFNKVAKLVKSTSVGLIIADSMTIFYRKYYGESGGGAKRARGNLASMMVNLLSLARETKIPIIITNQVYTDIETNTIKPIGGHVIDHNAKCIIQLEKMGSNLRKAILVKHRARKTGSEAYFKIVDEGLESYELFDGGKGHEERNVCMDNRTPWVREECR